MRKIYVDASFYSSTNRTGIGLYDPINKINITQQIKNHFTTSIEAEYYGIGMAMRHINSLKMKDVSIVTDCKTIVDNEYMMKNLFLLFGEHDVIWEPRENNHIADNLSKIANAPTAPAIVSKYDKKKTKTHSGDVKNVLNYIRTKPTEKKINLYQKYITNTLELELFKAFVFDTLPKHNIRLTADNDLLRLMQHTTNKKEKSKAYITYVHEVFDNKTKTYGGINVTTMNSKEVENFLRSVIKQS